MNRACGSPGFELARQLGRETTTVQFRDIYRLLLRVISSELLVSQAPKIFRMYFEGGEVAIRDVGKGIGVIEFSGWHGFDRTMWHDVLGGLEGFLVARRAVEIRHRVIRGGGSDGSMKAEFRWSMQLNTSVVDRRAE